MHDLLLQNGHFGCFAPSPLVAVTESEGSPYCLVEESRSPKQKLIQRHSSIDGEMDPERWSLIY